VILSLVVVISHITLELLGGVDGGTSSGVYSNLGWVVGGDVFNGPAGRLAVVLDKGLAGVTRGLLLVGVGAEVGVTGLGDNGTSALAELTFGDVDLGGRVVGGRAVDSVEVTVVGSVLNLDVGVVRGWGLVAEGRKGKVSVRQKEEVRNKWRRACHWDNNRGIGLAAAGG
jgi:hypothetical protein